MNRFKRSRHSGFTVLELLIATSITAMMLFLINRLFFDTVNAVGQGAQLGQILAASRAISEQIRRDADAMVGPSEGGFLVIINKQITGASYLKPDGSTAQRTVRSDQLVYIRKAQDLEPLTPSTANAFSNTVTAEYARLWYGHALRTDPDGNSPSDAVLGTDANNKIATNWILGRQALLLAGPAATGIYADGALFFSSLNGMSAFLWEGYTDVSNKTLADVIGTSLTNTIPNPDEPWSDNFYAKIAFRFAFPNSVHTGAVPLLFERRLRVNPNPSGTSFTSAQIAQMHPYWMENVSDFVVEFSMDTEPNVAPSEPDTHGATGNLVWRGLTNPWEGNLDTNSPDTGQPRYTRIVKDFNYSLVNEERYTFRHDYPDYWPYLIRIRYRLHDRKGRFSEHIGDSNSNLRESGKWFEQIISVNRE